jgi:predicted adenine nucleotide alpha hydrolase (AANH) superfamily ATPase
MRLLLHVCCAGCACYPLKKLREVKVEGKDLEITGFWYNPNIHPYSEYQNRMMTMGYFSQREKLPMIWKDEYALEEWLEATRGKFDLPVRSAGQGRSPGSWRKEKRCEKCYDLRLKKLAKEAKEKGYDYFSTTLLYSKFQEHEIIKEIGERLKNEYNINFYYADFRLGWKEGIEISRKMDLYRQYYCGCIFSEKEKYFPATEKK